MASNGVTSGTPKVAGCIFVAPVGSTAPTSASGALDKAYLSVGEIGESGVTRARSTDSKSIKNWHGDSVLTLQTSYEETFEFTMISAMNINALKAAYGDDNVQGSDNNLTINHTGDAPAAHSWVIDQVFEGGIPYRIYIPSAKITEIDDITYKVDEAVGYKVTLTAVADETSKTSIDFVGDGAATGA